MRLTRLLILTLGVSGLFLTGCLGEDSVVEEDTEAVIDPTAPTAEEPVDPNTVVCDPFDPNAGQQERTQGILASLYYLDSTQPQYNHVQDYIDFGHHVDEIDIYFNQLYVPTRPFDRGFVTQGGIEIQTEAGDTLYEWFALRFEGKLQLGPNDAPGDYEVAVLADDGAVWRLDQNNDGVWDVEVNNDGLHSTMMGCTTQIIHLNAGDKIPFQLDYNQGPRFHISLVTLWRPWTPGLAADSLCGRQSNSQWFDSTQDPPVPAAWYNEILTRGWKPIAPENYRLPGEEQPNPCNEPAPVITNYAASNVGTTSVTLNWTTSNNSSSQILYRDIVTGEQFQTTVNPSLVTSHTMTVTGLKPNTRYAFKAKSAAVSGRSTESTELQLRTAR